MLKDEALGLQELELLSASFGQGALVFPISSLVKIGGEVQSSVCVVL